MPELTNTFFGNEIQTWLLALAITVGVELSIATILLVRFVAHDDIGVDRAAYSGLFKAFFDVLPEGALLDKPVLIGATGGTARTSRRPFGRARDRTADDHRQQRQHARGQRGQDAGDERSELAAHEGGAPAQEPDQAIGAYPGDPGTFRRLFNNSVSYVLCMYTIYSFFSRAVFVF